MPLYKYTPNAFSEIKEKPFQLEREIQRMFEANLPRLMKLEMIKSEFTVRNYRIDTLAFDPHARAFVIIEYKKEKNVSVVDQGVTYLNLMLQNQADFILEYNETKSGNLKRNQVNWSRTKVVFVSQGFTRYQREAVNFKDLPIELWEVKRYENDSVSITSIRKSPASASIKTVMQGNREFKEVTGRSKEYPEESLLKGKPDEVVELYESYKNAILNLDTHMEVRPRKGYVSFKKANNSVCAIGIQRSGIKIIVNVARGHLDDSKQLTRDISSLGHFGTGDYEIKVSDTECLEDIMDLVRQAVK